MKRLKKQTVFIIIGATLVLGASLLLVIVWLNQPTEVGTDAIEEAIQAEPIAPKPITITLPNAQPIVAINENYDDPASIWIVVSKTKPLRQSDYQPSDLMRPPESIATNTTKSVEEQSLRQIIFEPLQALFSDAQQAGHKLFVASGYRSHQLQAMYFNNYARISGEAEANLYSARPGQSEHQTGLAFDVSTADRQCYLETCFGEMPLGRWLAQNAHKYGFILRYPEDKTEITGYQYEPWHFRFVGKDLATALNTSNLTLDEALPYLEKAQAEIKLTKANN